MAGTLLIPAPMVLAAGDSSPVELQLTQEQESKYQEIRKGGGANCASSSVVSIKVDGKDGDYTLDREGRLKKGPAEPQFSGCEDQEQVKKNKSSPTLLAATFGTFYFGPNRPSFYASDTNSQFWAQQSYAAGLPTSYRWAPSAYLKSIIYGEALTAYAFKSPANCGYNKAGQNEDYIFHWSCGSQSTSSMYYLYGEWAFRAAGPGWSGTATVKWDFNYAITYV
ncbi:hypothetical protein [Arthrobacter globiformis]|uniref:hypothetical protein n=1 Tax=Arthrobacter globiformis TaxID=1665 RepID=UPI0027D782F5|nr:hypothetical protein [Arthrobacter globiformis]